MATVTPPVRQNNVHIVIFKYKSTADEAARSAVAKAFDALQTQCVSISTGKPYIESLKAGMNYSEEGFDKGFEHAFVLEFATEGDREYYLNTDPAHAEFKKFAHPAIEDVLVFDFVPGMF
ncbi:hypothetical protein FRB96_001350 [Tulasnella sp. 330]|nr:hypothetical protein FRB96_001350 [Tulasnella sp. 330]